MSLLRYASHVIAIAMFCFSAHSSAFDLTHAKWEKVLKRYRAADGRVHYQRLKESVNSKTEQEFPAYLKDLSSVSMSEYASWGDDDRMAFLINAYNAFTIELVVDHYPTKSIRKIGGLFSNPWKIEFFSLLDAKIKTLDTIEHQYLRKQFHQPLVHAAINCASISCPVLAATPYIGKELGQQLEASFQAFLGDPSRNRYDAKAGELYLSEIFKWFGEDFQPKYGGYLNAIEKFGPSVAKEIINKKGKVQWIDYDWRLNDADSDVK